MKLNDILDAEDVEARIGTTNKSGFSLLLYKTARTDVKRLNEVHGDLWKNRYFHDTKGLLCCEISVYNSEIKEWVSRVDVGTESNTEKEKGSYSDAFKRAGFKWGIGAELYQSPFIWIKWEMSEYNGKFKPKGFFGSSITIDEFQVNDGIVGVHISHSNKKIYSSGIITPPKSQKLAEELLGSVTAISLSIAVGDLSAAQEAWSELTDEEKKTIWIPPSKGGHLTTSDRKIMQSKEFKEANQ
jgi:hypothetical protein